MTFPLSLFGNESFSHFGFSLMSAFQKIFPKTIPRHFWKEVKNWIASPANAVMALAIAAIMGVAGYIRWRGIFSDFWLDEIWSYDMTKEMDSPFDIFTRLVHDNNHPLNTLYMYLIGDQTQWFYYRIPSYLAGLASILLAGLIALRRGRLAAVTAAMLFGSSYLLMVMSTEARGYAPAIFFALFSLVLMDRFIERSTWQTKVIFGLSIIFGFLYHLTFVHFYFAILLWSACKIYRSNYFWRDKLIHFAQWHVGPLIFLGVYYFFFIRNMLIGGKLYYSLAEVIDRAVSLTFGAPETGLLAAVAGIAALYIFIAELFFLKRDQSEMWVLYISVIFLSPVLLQIIKPPEAMPVRYLILPLVFFLLLLSGFLARCFRRRGWGKTAFFIILLLILSGNGIRVAEFLKDGRGHYQEAVNYMAEKTDGKILTIGSDHDFRNKLVLNYYARRLKTDQKILYHDQVDWPAEGPLWYVAHSQESHPQPPEKFTDWNNNQYVLVKTYPYSGLSGWHWFLYRNISKD